MSRRMGVTHPIWHPGAIPSLLRPLLHVMPGLVKWLVLAIFLVNAKSWPLVWHLRIFRPVFYIRLKQQLVLWRTLLSSKATRNKRIDEWLDSISPIGENPFEKVISYKSRATIDESDFNGHLSNSSYAKTLDAARFKTALDMFPMFFRAGGWIALGATHFQYIREVPMLSEYEVRTRAYTWDRKWVFVLHKFVSKPRGMKPKNEKLESTPTPNGPADKAASNVFHPYLKTPVDATVDMETPSLSQTPFGGLGEETSATLKAVVAGLTTEEPDGAILHTIAISEVCFKIGRITVPPALVFAANGFSAPPSEFGSSLLSYSQVNPPPHWLKAKAVMSIPVGGSTKALQNLFKGGWRDVPPSERWWDHALSGTIERQRQGALESIITLRTGMEGLRAGP